MVEPLHPQLRRELLRANAGLADEDLDRLEELTALRFTLDPERDAARLREVDAERERLLREKVPRFREVSASFAAQRTAQASPQTAPNFTVEPNDPGPPPTSS
jgi:hypothetical protein